jgi:peptidyl-prolyl cis-trans isomerase C
MHVFRIRQAIYLAIGSTILLVSTLTFAADKKAPANKVAVVNGVIISQGEFDRGLELNKKRLASRGRQIPEEQMAKFRNEVLDEIINMELLYQDSKKKGIEVKPEVFSNQFTAFKQQFSDEDEYNKWIKENNFTEADFIDELKHIIAIRELIDKEVTEKVKISDDESKQYYDTHPEFFKQPEQVNASHILIKVNENASEAQKAEARKKIQEVQQKLQKGEDFETLAKTYSEGPSAPKGGNLGYFRRGQMVKPFEDAAFKLKPGETSDIVETRFGYHLIKVVDKQPEKTLAYAEIKDRLNELLKKQKLETEVDLYIENLRKDAKIEKFL